MQVTHGGDAPLLRAVNLTGAHRARDRARRRASRRSTSDPARSARPVALDVAVDALGRERRRRVDRPRPPVDGVSARRLHADDAGGVRDARRRGAGRAARDERGTPRTGAWRTCAWWPPSSPAPRSPLVSLARLVPAGDDPGAAAVDFTAAEDGAPASRYESVGAGDYDLVLGDAATGVGLSAEDRQDLLAGDRRHRRAARRRQRPALIGRGRRRARRSAARRLDHPARDAAAGLPRTAGSRSRRGPSAR